jgi:hypothetical protein
MTYAIDSISQPKRLVITITKDATKTVKEFKTSMVYLFQFDDKDTIRMATAKPGEEATSFTPDNTVVMRRKRNLLPSSED